MPSSDKQVRARVLEMARKDERKGDWKSALRRYRRLTGLDPDQPSLHIKLGDVCVRLGQAEDAADAFFTAGALFGKAAFEEKAAALYKRALESAPGRSAVRDALVEAYRRLGRTKDAIATLEQASLWVARQGDPRQALALRRRIAELDPLDVDARLRLARDLEASGSRKEALDEYVEALIELLRQGCFERAGGVFDAILALGPAPGPDPSAGLLAEDASSASLRPEAVDRLVDHARDVRDHFRALGELYRRAALLYRQEHEPV
jgi:tetratricopeptide (TPR) repeat protein